MREAFEKALKENMMDHHTRSVFADWLDDQDLPDEATMERDKIHGLKGLEQIATEMNQPARESYEKYKRQYPDEYTGRYEDEPDTMSREVTVEVLIEAGNDSTYCFGRDEDPQYMWENRERFWEMWAKATGKPIPERDSGSFSCAC